VRIEYLWCAVGGVSLHCNTDPTTLP